MRTDLSAHLGSIKWDLAPLWSVAPRVDNKNVGLNETNLLSLSYGCVIRKDINAIGGLRPESYETYNIIEPGDVVLRMTDLQNDQKSIRTGQTFERGLITSAYITVRPNQHKVEPRFLAAVLRAYDIQKTYYKMGAGVRQNLGYPEFTDLPVPLPDLTTQHRIADYLDRETGEIDTMIAKMDELAEQLEVRRAAVIRTELADREYHYPRVPLQGIGQIGSGDAISAEEIKDDGDYPVYGGNGRRGYTSSFNQSHNRVLVGRQGALCGNVHLAVAPFWASEHALLIRTYNEDTDLRWLAYAARDLDLGRLSTAAAQPGITASGVGRESIPLPPPGEQKRIADHLDEVTSRIDTMLAKVAELKSLLTERRAALITEVVTGRKDVA